VPLPVGRFLLHSNRPSLYARHAQQEHREENTAGGYEEWEAEDSTVRRISLCLLLGCIFMFVSLLLFEFHVLRILFPARPADELIPQVALFAALAALTHLTVMSVCEGRNL
jgi:hypothetical protein